MAPEHHLPQLRLLLGLIISKDFQLSSSSIVSNATMYIMAGAKPYFGGLMDITGNVNLEDSSVLAGSASKWTLRYPLIFKTVGTGSNGALPKAQVDLTRVELINLGIDSKYVDARNEPVFTADASVSVLVEGKRVFDQIHVDWSKSLVAPTFGNNRIGKFTFEPNYKPTSFKQNLRHLDGDAYDFFGLAQRDDQTGLFDASFTQGQTDL